MLILCDPIRQNEFSSISSKIIKIGQIGHSWPNVSSAFVLTWQRLKSGGGGSSTSESNN